MKQRILGNGGMTIGEIGLGCWQFGGDFGPMTEEAAFEIMAASVANGVNFFDTADVYGGGRSETLIGRFLEQSGADVRVATKFGRNADAYPNNYTLPVLRDSLLAARDRLRRDNIDLVQLHCIPIDVLRKGTIFDHLRTVQQEGLIKQFGVSVETEEQALLCLDVEGLQSMQVIFSILRQKLANIVLPKAQEKGVGIIVRLPLASGLLAGKYTSDTTFSDGDHRNYNRDGAAFYVGETFAGLPFQTGVALANSLKPQVPAGMTMAQMALRWVLDHEAVSVVIPGASSAAQATDNAAVSGMGVLSAETQDAFQRFYQSDVRQHIRGDY